MKRLLIKVIFLVVVLSPTIVFAGDIYSSKEYWGFYLDSCKRLDDDMLTVRKQMDNKSDSIFSSEIKRKLELMDNYLTKVDVKNRDQAKITICKEKSVKARELLSQAQSYEAAIDEKQAKEARKKHEASPLFKTALKLGYKDYGWLAALNIDYREVGDAELRKWIILVDNDCGRNFQAVQYVKPYVIYVPHMTQYSACSGKERVAVLPPDGEPIKRGQYIDRDSYYVFSGILEGKARDGFPIKMPLLKQYKKHYKTDSKKKK